MAQAIVDDLVGELAEEGLAGVLGEADGVAAEVDLDATPAAFGVEGHVPAGDADHGEGGGQFAGEVEQAGEGGDESVGAEGEAGIGVAVEFGAVLIHGVSVEATVRADIAGDAAGGEVIEGAAAAHAEGDVEDVDPVGGDGLVGIDAEGVQAVRVERLEKGVLAEEALDEEVGAGSEEGPELLGAVGEADALAAAGGDVGLEDHGVGEGSEVGVEGGGGQGAEGGVEEFAGEVVEVGFGEDAGGEESQAEALVGEQEGPVGGSEARFEFGGEDFLGDDARVGAAGDVHADAEGIEADPETEGAPEAEVGAFEVWRARAAVVGMKGEDGGVAGGPIAVNALAAAKVQEIVAGGAGGLPHKGRVRGRRSRPNTMLACSRGARGRAVRGR